MWQTVEVGDAKRTLRAVFISHVYFVFEGAGRNALFYSETWNSPSREVPTLFKAL